MSTLQARNERIIDAPIGEIWSIITDIDMLHKVNPGVVSAVGAMNKLNATRTCQINNRGKIGNITERLIEMEPGVKTVWVIENDDMGMSKMLKDARFCFFLEKIDDNRTKAINETWYKPANLIAMVMNRLLIKKMIVKTQQQILANLKSLTSKQTI